MEVSYVVTPILLPYPAPLSFTDPGAGYSDLHAFCTGRTLLPGNYWCDQVASIAAKDPCARHALLAFSTAYVLDFQPTEEMRLRANDHYRNAVRLLDQALQRQETYRTGSEDGIVAAIILILSNDVSVNRPGSQRIYLPARPSLHLPYLPPDPLPTLLVWSLTQG